MRPMPPPSFLPKHRPPPAGKSGAPNMLDSRPASLPQALFGADAGHRRPDPLAPLSNLRISFPRSSAEPDGAPRIEPAIPWSPPAPHQRYSGPDATWP